MYRNKFATYIPLIVLVPIFMISVGLYYGYTSTYTIYVGFVAYGVVTSIIFYYFLKYDKAILYLNKFGIENAKKEYNIKKGQKYIGIVIIHNNYKGKKALTTYISAPMLFIEYLKKKKKPFKLVIDPDYKKFEKLIEDQNCNELYIMGHGRLYRLKIGSNKKDTIWYRDFVGYPYKEKVVQLHCNHRDWFFKNRDLQSLTDILNAKTDFDQRGMSSSWQILDYFLNYIK